MTAHAAGIVVTIAVLLLIGNVILGLMLLDLAHRHRDAKITLRRVSRERDEAKWSLKAIKP